MTKSSTTIEPKCPGCQRILTDPAEYDIAKAEFDKRVEQAHLELSKKDKKEHALELHEIKTRHQTEIQRLRSSFKQQEVGMRKKFNAQSRNEKSKQKRRLEELRRDHQIALQQTRELYESQNLVAQKDREGFFNNQLKEMLQNYSNLATNSQKEIERIRKAQDDYLATMRRIETEMGRLKIGVVKSVADPQLVKVMTKLDERDATIADLRSKITELEARLLAAESSASTNNHEIITTISPGNSPSLQPTISLEGDELKRLEPSPVDTSNVPKEDIKPLAENNEDPRELFINAIKDINRNAKRPNLEKQSGTNGGEQESSNTNNNSSSQPEAKDKDTTTNVEGNRVTRFRKWFS